MAVIGGTGSGKTFLMREFLKLLAIGTQSRIPINIIDSKMMGDFDSLSRKGIGTIYRGNQLPPVENKDGSPFIIWQPLEDDMENYNQYFKQIYDSRKPCIVFIDELSSITGRTGIAPRYYSILLKQGRGMKISVITLSQMARLVPLELLSQLMHIIIMNLNSERDKKKLVDLVGDMAKIEIKDQHGFIYRDVSKPIRSSPPHYYENAFEFLGIE